MKQYFKISGSGSYLPSIRLSAEDVEKKANLPPGWVKKHTGVHTRYQCSGEESLQSMAVTAIQRALDDASMQIGQIDLIIDASTCRHQPIPCNAAIVQSALGKEANGIACMDIQGTCLGFILALNVANALLGNNSFNKILIVCSEAALAGVNWNEPESATILGDGAAAIIIQKTDPTLPYLFHHETFSEFIQDCEIKGGGHRIPPYTFRPEILSDFLFHMEGPKVFKTARRKLPSLVRSIYADNQISPEDLLVIPHQASPKAVENMRRVLKFPKNRFVNKVESMGNLISASIPMVISQIKEEGILLSQQKVMLLGTSAGYGQAALVFNWL